MPTPEVKTSATALLTLLLAVTSSFHTRRVDWTLRTFAANGSGWQTVAPEFIKLPYYWARFGVLARPIGREHSQS